MFWKKNQAQATPASAGAAAEASPKQKSEKAKVEKLSGPRAIPALVEKQLIAEYKVDAGLVQIFKAVIRRRPQAERAFDCCIFDPSEAEVREIKVNDYNALDQHQDLILYEGWFDEDSKQVQIGQKRKVSFDVPLFTETEILQKIEALSEPGSTVYFYQARGPAFGGPLGRGAAIVELNPDYGGKKGKKYIIYTANVIGTEPVAKRTKLFDSDKPKEIAKWIKEAHHKRVC